MPNTSSEKRIKNLKILVTGGRGFLGSYLVPALKNHFKLVKNYDRDVRSIDTFSEKFDVVCHLASVTKPKSLKQKEELLDTAYQGTLAVSKYCKKQNAWCIFASSASVYKPTLKNQKILENGIIQPADENGLGKYISELILKYYHESFGISVTILRIFNLYGPGQNKSFLVPYVLRQFFKNRPIHLKSPHLIRDFIHVYDVVNAIIKIINTNHQNGLHIFNLGSGTGYSVSEVLEHTKKMRMKSVKVSNSKKTVLTKKISVVADISKIQRIIHWKPQVSLPHGLNSMLNKKDSKQKKMLALQHVHRMANDD